MVTYFLRYAGNEGQLWYQLIYRWHLSKTCNAVIFIELYGNRPTVTLLSNQYDQSWLRELNQISYHNTHRALLANLINGGLLAVALWPYSASHFIISWVIYILVVCAIRANLVRRFNSSDEQDKADRRWYNYALIGQLNGAIIWAVPSLILFPVNSESAQVFVAFVIGGMAAGSLTSLAYSKLSIHLFLAISLIPLFVRFVLADSEFAPFMAFMVMLGYGMTLFSGLRVHKDLHSLIRLKLENKRQSASLNASERYYQALINQASEAFFLVDKKGNIITANELALQFSGYSLDQLTSHSLNIKHLLIMPGPSGCISQWANISLDETINFSCSFRDNAEKETPVDVSAKSLTLNNELRISLFVKDVSERQAQQNKLAEAKSIVDFHLHHTPLGYIATDKEGRVTDWNASAKAIFGYSKKEMLGQYPQNFLLKQEVLPEVQVMWEYINKSKASTHLTNNNVRKDGREITCEWFTTPILDTQDNLTGMASFVMDVSDAVAYEKALKAAKKQAELASQAKTRFLSHMSHELRTPLNSILGYAQLIQMDAEQLNAIQQKNIGQIVTSGRYLLNMINELLDINALEAGKVQVQLAKVPLDDLIEDCLSNIGPQAKAKAIRIDNQITDSACHILADSQRAKQVILNLLSNAIKYNHEQGKVALYYEKRESHKIRVYIEDAGPGIKDAEKATLFTPFERFHEDRTIEGTGIGLSISKMLMELMRGEIGVHSTYGKGSVFWLEFELVGADSQT